MAEIRYVDEISSISQSIFSCKYKKKIIKKPPFICKEKLEKNGSSAYHFDVDDLTNIHQDYPEVVPFTEALGLSKEDYINKMKTVFEQIIKNGDFVRLLSKLYGTTISDIEIRWASDISGLGEEAIKLVQINRCIQDRLLLEDRTSVTAVEAAQWLAEAGLLKDSSTRKGKPLRELLRAGQIWNSWQNKREEWFIDRAE